MNKKPDSTDFISMLPNNSVKKLEHCGWDIEKTLFLEVSYIIGSAAGSVILKDYENKVYYMTLIFTKSVVKRLSLKELKIIVDHEKWEFDELQENAKKESRAEFVPHDEEEIRHVSEMQRLYEMHGKNVVEKSFVKANRIAMNKPLIDRTIGIYWLYLFVIKNFNRLNEYAFEMTDAMLSNSQKKGYLEVINRTESFYGSGLPMNEVMSLTLLKGKLAETLS